MKITRRQLRRIIKERLEGSPHVSDDQRRLVQMLAPRVGGWVGDDPDLIHQVLSLNSTLGILPEPTDVSFPASEWDAMTDDERRALEGIPIDEYPGDFPIRPSVMLVMNFTSQEDLDKWHNVLKSAEVGKYVKKRSGMLQFWMFPVVHENKMSASSFVALCGVVDHVLSEAQDDPDYLSLDDIGISSTQAHGDDEQEMEDEDIQQLTQQRQQAMDSGNAVDANAAGQKLAMLRKKHG